MSELTREEREKRIAEIRERAEAAVKGPWRWFGNTEVDQVYLGTAHSGRIFILSPEIRRTDTVYDWESDEEYSVEMARQYARDLENANSHYPWLMRDHGNHSRLLEFLTDPFDENDPQPRHFTIKNSQPLTRWIKMTPELRLIDQERGVTVSHHDLVRYDVLGAKTRAEAGLDAGAGRSNSPLYREDFTGITTPEAEFIAHSREDVDLLLAEIDRLRDELAERG